MREFQNDLVHGWGIDFGVQKCVEVSGALHFSVTTLLTLLLVILLWSYIAFATMKVHCYAFLQPAHEKIGIVDAQWIVHQSVPSLGNQVCVYIYVYILFAITSI